MAWHWSFLDLEFSFIKIHYDARECIYIYVLASFILPGVGMHMQAEIFWKCPIQIEPYITAANAFIFTWIVNAFLDLINDYIQIAQV